ncbi:MAG: flagellar hook-associated protein FlgL [Bacillota bacterium]|nr:flagellar hook-associated protein FlgL [Bacillota bacterium]
MLRITNNMMVNDLRRNLNNNMVNMDKYQRQLSTGKKINKPSDDPAGLVRSLRLRTNITEGEQYLDNIGEAINFMETTDSAMNNVNQILQRARELTVAAANGTNDTSAHGAISAEIRQLNEQLQMIANTTYGTKHVFGGRNVSQAPCQDGKWLGNDQELQVEIGVGASFPMNLQMKDFFMGTEPYVKNISIPDRNVIDTLTAENLESGNYSIATQKKTGGIMADARLSPEMDHFLQNGASTIFAGKTLNLQGADTLTKNAAIELTVSGINSTTGDVTYAYKSNEYDRDTGAYEQKTGTFTLTGGGGEQTVSIGSSNIKVAGLTPAEAGDLAIGDKAIYNIAAAHGTDYDQIALQKDYTSNDGAPLSGGTTFEFVFTSEALDQSKLDLKFFSCDDLGQSFDSTISLQIGTLDDVDPAAYFTTKPGLFKMIDELADDIEAGNLDKISNKLGNLDDKIDEILYRRSTIGARINRLELQQSRLDSTQISFTGLLSQNEDVDMAEVITQLKMQENVYRASLSAGARIIQPSLVDFLR